jgi:hypothetical protein
VTSMASPLPATSPPINWSFVSITKSVAIAVKKKNARRERRRDSGRPKRLRLILGCVIGARFTLWKHLFFGSDAENIPEHVPCPVLVVREFP